MTSEEQLIKRYFDAFNRHDVEGVVACFHAEAVLVAPDGQRVAGIAEVRRSYEAEFAKFRDAHCELRVCTGNGGRGVAESYFTGTREGRGKVEAIGAEVMEIVDGKIKEIRDYHHAVPTKAAEEATVAARS
jgi:ketosteroid isomerase-like protein